MLSAAYALARCTVAHQSGRTLVGCARNGWGDCDGKLFDGTVIVDRFDEPRYVFRFCQCVVFSFIINQISNSLIPLVNNDNTISISIFRCTIWPIMRTIKKHLWYLPYANKYRKYGKHCAHRTTTNRHHHYATCWFSVGSFAPERMRSFITATRTPAIRPQVIPSYSILCAWIIFKCMGEHRCRCQHINIIHTCTALQSNQHAWCVPSVRMRCHALWSVIVRVRCRYMLKCNTMLLMAIRTH